MKKYFSIIFLFISFLVTAYSFKDGHIEEQDSLPTEQPHVIALPILLEYPHNLSFVPRIQQEEYFHAILSTPLVQLAPQYSPPIGLEPGMFLPRILNFGDGLLALSWKLNAIDCTFNNLQGDFGIFDFCNFSQSTIQNSRLNFPRFIGGNLTETKWNSIKIRGGDFYGVLSKNFQIRDSEFTFSRFQEMDFTGALIQNSSFTNCIITESCVFSLETISIKNCCFTKCTMPTILGAILAAQENVQIIDPLYVD